MNMLLHINIHHVTLPAYCLTLVTSAILNITDGYMTIKSGHNVLVLCPVTCYAIGWIGNDEPEAIELATGFCVNKF